MNTPQFDFPAAADCFNLASEQADDPWRIDRQRWQAAQAREASAEYAAKMQRTFEQCPGFIGADCPTSDQGRGRVVIEPAKVVEAYAWLRRRFHVNENLELSTDNGLCIEVAPRVRRSTTGRRSAKVRFKVEQFKLPL